MRAFLSLLLVLIVGAIAYAYLHNPAAYAKLCRDVAAVFTQTTAPVDAPPPAPVVPTKPVAATPATNAPPVTGAPAILASTNTVAATPPAPPFKRWIPPATIPAQPHWTWTTDDKTYQEVVIDKFDANTVTITHTMGVTHLDIATLPADIQKQLNYDPEVAAAAKAETKREMDHPYYPMSDIAGAEALAKQMHWPVAWLFSDLQALSTQNPNPESYDGMTQLALNDLKTQAVVIFEKGNDELSLVPPAVKEELFHLDDGPLPDGHHYNPPKIVFSNPDATKTFGRVAYTQIKAAGMEPIDAILSNIQSDPAIQAALGNSAPVNTPASPTVTTQSATLSSTNSASSVPPPNPTPASGTNSPTVTASPPAPLFKKWTPPAVLPAQPHWTWTTDDKTYQDVVIDQINANMVTITHSMGVTHLDIATLPADVQKQLNYDPETAAAEKVELQRETDHPYYAITELADAQAFAKRMRWPLAWLSTNPKDFQPSAQLDVETQLTLMAANFLKDKSIIVLIDDHSQMNQTPQNIHHQFSQFDDGSLPDNANYIPPKVVFSSPDTTQIFGRVSYTQMKASGTAALDSVFSTIQNDPNAQAILNGQPAPAPTTNPK